MKLIEIIEKSEALEEINWIHIYPKTKQLKAYYQEPVYFIATFVTNAIQGGIIAPERHVGEAIYAIAKKQSDDAEECMYLEELFSFQTHLI